MLKLKTHSGFHDLFLKYSIIQLYCNMNGNNSVLRMSLCGIITSLCPMSMDAIIIVTFHILTFSSQTSKLIETKLGRNVI
jgi:hypothetical protein